MIPSMNENHHIATRSAHSFRAMGFVACLVLLVAVPPLRTSAQHYSSLAYTSSSGFDPAAVPASTELHIPGAFTPDGDGINDVFLIDADGITSVNLVIYDRLGKAVFHTTSLGSAWNGLVDNNPAPAGVYLYEFVLHSTALGHVHRTGTVMLTHCR